SRDGTPGPKYWQNRASYRIAIDVSPPDRTVRGTESIVYRNASPDTLKNLVIKLFMNVHKPGAPRFHGVQEDFFTSGVHVDSFAVDGAAREWKDVPYAFTQQPAKLPAPLAPGDSVRLRFDWHYDLAEQASREGVIDSTTFYVAYFYPRVAVRDDYQGWDTMEHTPSHEFYSDFNDYDVTVRAPAGWVVWGTGTLRNADELLKPAALARYRASTGSDTVIHVATLSQMQAGDVTAAPAGSGPVAWHFTAEGVPDVAFGMSDHYDWDAASVVVDDAAGRRASVQAAYNDTAADFHEMVGYARHALDWLSHDWPGVPYPYPKMTVFQGGAGMEYPMMANDAAYSKPDFGRFVAEHEIAHTYMPFYMGIDETRYGFMDEGWATTFEYLVGVQDMGREKETAFFKQFRVNDWIHDPSADEDLPITTPGDVLGGAALGNNEYGKAAIGYLAMKDLLGDALFKRCLQAYIARWHGKHPSPWDFFYTFDDVAGRSVDWLWSNWFFSNHYLDLATTGAEKAGDGYDITLENVGGMYAPVDLVLGFADGSLKTVHETPAIWQEDGKRAVVHVKADGTLTSVGMDHRIWVDADTTNDGWKAKGS
ncbi:MAG TPA: M1 family metallopeptidase, partial [Gemmatimonadota bacterium]|nr:M1 family metallopeptidase [Gemmatimonadota bacterium]